MKKFKIFKTARAIGVFALCAAVFTAVSCNNAFTDKENVTAEADKVILSVNTIDIEDAARTVLPTRPETTDLVNFKLYGAKYDSNLGTDWSRYSDDQKVLVGTYADYEAITTAKIELEANTKGQNWFFYLTAENGLRGPLYAGKSNNGSTIQLQLKGTNRLTFNLSLVNLGTGSGTLDFTLDYSTIELNKGSADDVDTIVASIYAVDANGTVAEYETASWTIDVSEAETDVLVLNKPGIPANTYRLFIKLYKNDETENVFIGQWIDTVFVGANKTSTGSGTINYLNDAFNVVYHLNLSEDEAASVNFPESQYFVKGTRRFSVPVVDGKLFLGWQTRSVNDNNEEVFTPVNYFLSSGNAGLDQNLEVWAKWEDEGSLDNLTPADYFDAIRNLDPALTSEDEPVLIKITGTGIYSSSIGTAIKDNPDAYFALDLSEATLSNNNKISSSSFRNCTNLMSIELPESLTSIDNYSFQGCTNLMSIELPESLTSIGSYSFQGCTNLMSIELPARLTSIGGYSFYGCTNLMSIELPESLTSIESYSFSGCSNLMSIELPENLNSINGHAFDGTALTSIELPESLMYLYGDTFYNTRITSITIPKNVKYIEPNALRYSVSYLEEIIVDSDNANYHSDNGVLYSNAEPNYSSVTPSALYCYPAAKTDTSFAIEEGTVNIMMAGVQNLNYIQDLTIPASLTNNIHYFNNYSNVFRSVTVSEDNPNYSSSDGVVYSKDGTQLLFYPRNKAGTSFTIPADVTTIGYRAFYYAQNLTNVTFNANLNLIASRAFQETSSSLTFTTADSALWCRYNSSATSGITYETAKNGSLITSTFNTYLRSYKASDCWFAKSTYTDILSYVLGNATPASVYTDMCWDVSDESYTVVDLDSTLTDNYFIIDTVPGQTYVVNYVDSYTYDDLSYTNCPSNLRDSFLSVWDNTLTIIGGQQDDTAAYSFTARTNKTLIDIVNSRGNTGKTAFRVRTSN